MEFRALGPLEVVDDGRVLELGSGRQLALVAMLLLHANESVSVDRIVDELWGDAPPPTAAKIVRNNVSLLRKELGDRLLTRPSSIRCAVHEAATGRPRAPERRARPTDASRQLAFAPTVPRSPRSRWA